MKNNKFVFGVVVVFAVLFMFFAFFFGFRVVRAQFGVVGLKSVVSETAHRNDVVVMPEIVADNLRHVEDANVYKVKTVVGEIASPVDGGEIVSPAEVSDLVNPTMVGKDVNRVPDAVSAVNKVTI